MAVKHKKKLKNWPTFRWNIFLCFNAGRAWLKYYLLKSWRLLNKKSVYCVVETVA